MSKQRGSILLSVVFAIGILASISAMWVQYNAMTISHLKQQQAAQQGVQIVEATINYYVDQSPAEASRWPESIDDLIAAEYLPAKESVYGTAWSLSIEADVGTLSLDVPTILDARAISAKLPRGESDSTAVTATLNRPGDEAIHLELYALDGRLALTDELNLSEKGITNAGAITYE